MHPSDVSEFVRSETVVLCERIEGRDDLGVQAVHLSDGLTLEIWVEVSRYTVERGAVRSPLVVGAGASRALGVLPPVPILGTSVADVVVLRMDFTNFDATPPTAELLTADHDPLPSNRWPRGVLNAAGVVADHAKYGRPFICRQGLREYHDHAQHADDPWDLHRETMRLSDIVIGVLSDLQKRWVSPR